MTLDEIRRHRHYQRAGGTPVCGFAKTVRDAEATGETKGVEYPILKVRTTTDVAVVSCPACANWLRRVVTYLPFEE